MKRSKRQESSVIIYFSFYAILLVILLIYLLSFLYPRVNVIESKKETTKSSYEKLESVTKSGINYTEFNSLKSTAGLTSYQVELLKNIDGSFYTQNLKNTTKDDYLTFLKNTIEDLNNPIEKEKFEKKEEQVVKILPPYSESEVDGANNLLSDFKFINYIENILATFSLEYSNEIGISNIHLVEDFSEIGSSSSLETDIYYIPLSLSLEGTKYNIINFLYFIENVGNIKILKNEINIDHQNDDNFLYRGVKILLKNDQPSTINYSQDYIDNYNIFENQLIDIESIEFGNYLDDSVNPDVSDTQSLASRVKETQGNDEIAIDLELRFYIKGVQNLKIIEHLRSYITYFNTTKTLIGKEVGNKDLNSIDANRVKVMQSDINEMTSGLKDINIAISKQENLNEILKKVSDYINILDIMHNKLGYNVYISNFIIEYNTLIANKKNQTNNPVLYSYLLSIESEIDLLKQSVSESKESYNDRLNNKKLFENIRQIVKNIELKK